MFPITFLLPLMLATLTLANNDRYNQASYNQASNPGQQNRLNQFGDSKTWFNDGLKRLAAGIPEYMADTIAKSEVAQKSSISKRGFANLKNDIKDYIQWSYVDPAIASFQPIMDTEIDHQFKKFNSVKVDPRKHSLEENTQRKKLFSKWLSVRMDAKLKNYLGQSFQKWKSNPFAFSRGSIEKRGFFEDNPKNKAILMIVTGFLFIPLFVNPLAMGLWSIIIGLGFGGFIFPTILRKILFGGKWQWL